MRKYAADLLPIHYLFKGETAHIVTDSSTIYSAVRSSLGVILQTVQPYHHYSTCHITDRRRDLRGKKKKAAFESSAWKASRLFLNYFRGSSQTTRSCCSWGGNCARLPGRESDDASAQLCGEWAIYDKTVTPALLNRPPPLRRDMLLLHSFESEAFLTTILVPFRRGRKQRLELSSAPNVFFYGNGPLRNLKGILR